MSVKGGRYVLHGRGGGRTRKWGNRGSPPSRGVVPPQLNFFVTINNS